MLDQDFAMKRAVAEDFCNQRAHRVTLTLYLAAWLTSPFIDIKEFDEIEHIAQVEGFI
jgi:hypothetical protein